MSNFPMKQISEIYKEVKSDRTKIGFIEGGIFKEANENEFKDRFDSQKERYVFSSWVISKSLNVIHFTMLSKMQKLQNYGMCPFINLRITEQENREKILASFKEILDYYFGKDNYGRSNYELKSQETYEIDKKTMSALSKVFINDNEENKISLEQILSPRIYNDSILRILMPFIVNNMQQEKNAFLLCGEDVLSYWEWRQREYKSSSPLIFVLPELLDSDGNKIDITKEKGLKINHGNFNLDELKKYLEEKKSLLLQAIK